MRYIHFIFIAFLFLACGRSESLKYKTEAVAFAAPDTKQEEQKEQTAVADTAASFSPPQPGEPEQTKQSPNPSQSPASKPDWNRKIIKTAALNVEVKDYQKFNQLVHSAANQFAGYIAGKN